ncbi:MAG TPA: hypothetical protein V6C97_26110 [Oculatellaceae cyanobacterium]
MENQAKQIDHAGEQLKPNDANKAMSSALADAWGKEGIKQLEPKQACVRDDEGFMVCGPIVGYPKPEESKTPSENPSIEPFTGGLKENPGLQKAPPEGDCPPHKKEGASGDRIVPLDGKELKEELKGITGEAARKPSSEIGDIPANLKKGN